MSIAPPTSRLELASARPLVAAWASLEGPDPDPQPSTLTHTLTLTLTLNLTLNLTSTSSSDYMGYTGK